MKGTNFFSQIAHIYKWCLGVIEDLGTFVKHGSGMRGVFIELWEITRYRVRNAYLVNLLIVFFCY